MKNFYLYLVIIVFTASCISEKELVSKIDSSNCKEKIEIDHIYYNKNLSSNSYQDLIQIIRYQNKKSIFKNYKKLSDSLQVKLVYDGIDHLLFSYNDTNNNIINQSIKVKNKGNYLTFKRKVTIIPIPFIFFYYWNEKSIIYIDNDENLNFISGQNQFIWIFLAGGGKSIYENKFEKLSK